MSEKKKILLLCDDIRSHSGIATMGKELIIGTAHKYNWINMAGMINHPDKGKRFDLSAETNQIRGITNSSVILYPVDNYGDETSLFSVINAERPDAILIFTDPRFWIWLFALENQIRQSGIPITYLNIWDDIPYPMYNRPYYESVDCLFSISKQTYNINKWVLGPENCCTINGEFDKNGKINK